MRKDAGKSGLRNGTGALINRTES